MCGGLLPKAIANVAKAPRCKPQVISRNGGNLAIEETPAEEDVLQGNAAQRVRVVRQRFVQTAAEPAQDGPVAQECVARFAAVAQSSTGWRNCGAGASLMCKRCGKHVCLACVKGKCVH